MKSEGNRHALYKVSEGECCATKRGSSPFGTRLVYLVLAFECIFICNYIPIIHPRQELDARNCTLSDQLLQFLQPKILFESNLSSPSLHSNTNWLFSRKLIFLLSFSTS
ncbi:hypothetical protein GHT06_017143 [Daphnia sinensis]|uniref:Uncharacterized protein n=1 Tax=Daphnia sinensis TaxID=1820382 RepID=A0AAD5L8L3_9CRUS|nr:hypothetical protein GHT06_017143 [Daphnia sinensis]